MKPTTCNRVETILFLTIKVKELIRRAKAWRNRSWLGEKSGRPKSYLMSLLVITAYCQFQALEDEKNAMVFARLAMRYTPMWYINTLYHII